MTARVDIAEIVLWGKIIGAVAWDEGTACASFEYAPAFLSSGIQLAPLMMPLQPGIMRFPDLSRRSFHGLPGMLADSLPDKFGNLLIDQWLIGQGRDLATFSPIERLCYIGNRGMGALEFRPGLNQARDSAVAVDIDALIQLANQVLTNHYKFQHNINNIEPDRNADAINDIIRVGTSAGGARAKAVIAWNPDSGEIRSGQTRAPAGFEHWLIKFDGIANNRDKELLADPQGYGKIEYAYYLMATAAGIDMAHSRLLTENGRSHFMTRRFDRTPVGEKLHLQSLCALAHYDFNLAGAYSYEQALLVMQRLQLPHSALLQLYKRMVFNIIARNQDDHTKNISFLMNKQGEWSLAPAYDLTYSFNPVGEWTNRHQMTINGKQDNFNKTDLIDVARRFNITKTKSNNIIADILNVIEKWPDFAKSAGIDPVWTAQIAQNHRVGF